MLIIGLLLVVPFAQAGPITGGSGTWPYVKLGVYQGVLSISTSSTSALEIGAAGKDIATSSGSAIILRPDAVAASNGALLSASGGVTRLKIPGQVCLYPSGISQPPSCYNQWPAGGSTLWTRVVDADGFGQLQTITTGLGVRIGSSSSRVTGGTALTAEQSLLGFDIDALNVANASSSGPAVELTGDAVVSSQATIGGRLRVNSQEVYHPADAGFGVPVPKNDGVGSGLDADRLDGYDVTLRNGSSCGALGCLCFTFGSTTSCAPLRNNY